MKERKVDLKIINCFHQFLVEEEKSDATVEKYLRDVTAFAARVNGMVISKEMVIAYKQSLVDDGYAVRSINSILASLNCLFAFMGWNDLKVKSLKIQQQTFCPEDRELSKPEYERLCRAAERQHNERLSLILQSICSTGIRVSELEFITVEAVRAGKATVSLKGKTRVIFLVKALRKKLLRYIARRQLVTGAVFVTRSGKTINRTSVWREMKKLCEEAAVDPRKVFPHNLRHLFARIFYKMERDIVKLADILGHSSINTTRIYIISTGTEHRRRMEQMRLVI